MSAAQTLAARGAEPRLGIVLGSGLGGLVDALTDAVSVPYGELEGFPEIGVGGHAGAFVFGRLNGLAVACFAGRKHTYEGDVAAMRVPIRTLRALGAEALLVTNAAGSLRADVGPGRLMLIADHINLLGDNPLVGPNDDRLGPRFPDMSSAYDEAFRALARQVALERRIPLREGVYVAVAGPNLETRAEYRFLRAIGADVVGMSTVPEVIVAVHAGMRVLGLSIITDSCLPDALAPATVEQIISVANAAEPKLTELVRGVLEKM